MDGILGLNSLTSCYSYVNDVGEGAQGDSQTTPWNITSFNGLTPVGVSDSEEMPGGADNYTIPTRHSFMNNLVSEITSAIYTPPTTPV